MCYEGMYFLNHADPPKSGHVNRNSYFENEFIIFYLSYIGIVTVAHAVLELELPK